MSTSFTWPTTRAFTSTTSFPMISSLIPISPVTGITFRVASSQGNCLELFKNCIKKVRGFISNPCFFHFTTKAAIPPINSMNTANQANQYTSRGNIQINSPIMMASAIIVPPLACCVSTIISPQLSCVFNIFFHWSSSLIPPITGAKKLYSRATIAVSIKVPMRASIGHIIIRYRAPMAVIEPATEFTIAAVSLFILIINVLN